MDSVEAAFSTLPTTAMGLGAIGERLDFFALVLRPIVLSAGLGESFVERVSTVGAFLLDFRAGFETSFFLDFIFGFMRTVPRKLVSARGLCWL